MPIMLPAPALFSTTNCCPSALDKCCASTRPMMSVPPEGGEGTTMRTARAGYSLCADACADSRTDIKKTLAHCIQHRPGRDKHEGDDAGLRAAVHPVVDRAALHEDIALAQVNGDALVELHVDLARKHDGVVDRLGPVVARRDTGVI